MRNFHSNKYKLLESCTTVKKMLKCNMYEVRMYIWGERYLNVRRESVVPLASLCQYYSQLESIGKAA